MRPIGACLNREVNDIARRRGVEDQDVLAQLGRPCDGQYTCRLGAERTRALFGPVVPLLGIRQSCDLG